MPDTFISLEQVADEAAKCRKILDEQPPNDQSDMLYAAYNALLFVLDYHVMPPSELFGGSSEEVRQRMITAARRVRG